MIKNFPMLDRHLIAYLSILTEHDFRFILGKYHKRKSIRSKVLSCIIYILNVYYFAFNFALLLYTLLNIQHNCVIVMRSL